MSTTGKIILFSMGTLSGLLLMAALFLIFFVDINTYKTELEATASSTLGMDVKVDGRLGIGFYPALRVTLGDVHLSNQGVEVTFVKQIRLGLELIPMLQQQAIHIHSVTLKQLKISIERDAAGNFNFNKHKASGASVALKKLTAVSLSDATLVYTDKQSGDLFETRGCSLDLRQMRLSGVKPLGLMKRISFTAQLACKEFRRNDFMVSDIKISAKANKGVVEFKPVTMRLFGAQGRGAIKVDLSGAVPLYHVDYSLRQFQIEKFFKTQVTQKVAEGLMDFSVKLSMRGETVKKIRQSAEGHVSLRGENLMVNGTDFDEAFARFESSQQFNLVDAGAFFFAGPVGLAVTKGYNFANLLQESTGHSKIRTLVSDWTVEHGVAQALDVAMATEKNRISLQGGLDFVNEQFDGVIIALIDTNGCAEVKQTIRGDFQTPEVGKPSVFKSLAGPAFKLLEKGKSILSDDECDVFYNGSVSSSK
ncbi:MAG: AsmA protein [Marinomonas primoryensis]|jgi:uncharacterized protein involved in outer membrane biogenesis